MPDLAASRLSPDKADAIFQPCHALIGDDRLQRGPISANTSVPDGARYTGYQPPHLSRSPFEPFIKKGWRRLSDINTPEITSRLSALPTRSSNVVALMGMVRRLSSIFMWYTRCFLICGDNCGRGFWT